MTKANRAPPRAIPPSHQIFSGSEALSKKKRTVTTLIVNKAPAKRAIVLIDIPASSKIAPYRGEEFDGAMLQYERVAEPAVMNHETRPFSRNNLLCRLSSIHPYHIGINSGENGTHRRWIGL